MQLLVIVAALVLLIWLVSTYITTLDSRIKVEAFDGRSYLVQDTRHKVETANAIAELNRRFERVLAAADGNAQTYDMKMAVLRLKQKYRPENVTEAMFDPSLTSYTIGKGKELALCLRSRDEHGRLYDYNLMMTVMCHEAAHIMSISIGHGKEFVDNFRFLLGVAQKQGLYQPYSKPVEYCGMQLKHH